MHFGLLKAMSNGLGIWIWNVIATLLSLCLLSSDHITWRYLCHCARWDRSTKCVFLTGGCPWSHCGFYLNHPPVSFAYYSGVSLRGLAHSPVVWLIAESELVVCIVIFFLSANRNKVLIRRALDPPGWYQISVSWFLLSLALRRLVDDMGFLRIINASSFDPVLFFVAYYGSDEVDLSVFDLFDTFMLYNFAAGRVHRSCRRRYPVARTLPGSACPTGSSAGYRLVSAKGLV